MTKTECNDLLKEAIKEMTQKNYVSSLVKLNKIVIEAKENQWNRELFLAYNNIGANYYNMLDYGEAINNYLEAYKIAIANFNYKEEMVVLNNIAILYSKNKDFYKAEDYFTKAYQLAKNENDSVKIGFYAVNLATVSNDQKKSKNAINYISIAKQFLYKSDMQYLVEIAELEYLVNNHQSSKAIEIAQKVLPELNKPELVDYKIAVLLNLAQTYIESKDYQKANLLIESTKKLQDNLETKELIIGKKINLFRAERNLDSAFYYQDSLMVVHDAFGQLKNSRIFENNKIKFELQSSKKELKESHLKLELERKYFLIFTILGVLFFGCVIWALRNEYFKQKQQKIINSQKQQFAELALEQEKNEKLLLENQFKEKEMSVLLEQEKLKNEIDNKNRKLVTSALQYNSRLEIINKLILTIQQQNSYDKNNELKNIVQKLKQNIKENQLQEDFFLHFEEVNLGWLQKLQTKFPELNQNDLRFLSYLYMNLSTKEIASLLNITEEACRKRKERISRKMNISENEDLFGFISVV